MLLDIIFAIPIVFGVYKGYKSGIVKVLLILIFFLIGLSLGMKFIPMLSSYLKESFEINPGLLPIISFLIVFILTLLLGKIVIKLLESLLKLIYMNWINKIIGSVLGMATSVLILSTLVYLSNNIDLISLEAKSSSFLYPYIEPVAPTFYAYMPLFKDWLKDLELFFDVYLK